MRPSGGVRVRWLWALLATVLVGAPVARAETPHIKIRVATIAPDGTAWARELHAFGRDVEQSTGGMVSMKYYFGAIAGDELAALDRVKKGQLDGIAGAIFCPRIAPSLWVARLVGLFRNRDEARQVLNRLRPLVDKELEQSGFVSFGLGSFGNEIFFSRTPVHSMADLRKGRYWTWNLDDFWVKELPAMGIGTVPLSVEEAAQAYDDGRIDGFLAVPTAALAFQWSVRAHHFTNLSAAFMPGCLAVARRVFDAIPADQQRAILAAAAKFAVRFDTVSGPQEDALFGGLFEHQGLKRAPGSESFAGDFSAAAQSARETIGEKLVSKELLAQVTAWLVEIRAAQPKHPTPTH